MPQSIRPANLFMHAARARGQKPRPRPGRAGVAPCARLLPAETQTPAHRAKEHEIVNDALPDPGTVLLGGRRDALLHKMTLGNGYLGSCIDEERSEMRYLV